MDSTAAVGEGQNEGQSNEEHVVQNIKQCGEQWSKNLSEKELSAVRDYTGTAYIGINAALRGIEKEMHPANAECANTLHRVLKQTSLPEDCIVYRGTSSKALGVARVLPDSMLVGRTFTDRGFMSTSLYEKDAFGGEILLEIEAKKGSHGIYVGYSSSAGHYESEVLFDAGQTMKIIDVRRDESGRRILRVEMRKKE